MKRWHLLLVLALMLLLGTAATAQAESYTEFCTLDAHFTWLESGNVHTEPYTSSPTTGKTVAAGDVVFIQRLVKNEYGNLWAELFTGGYLCFYDKASDKECASFVSISNGAAPVTTSKISAPEGEIVQGTSFTFSGILDSSSVCPIFLFDIWCGVGGGHAFDEHISSWPSGVTTKIDITDYNINELYDISTLPPGEYNYTIRVWIGFTYEGHQFAFGDKYVPVQKTFTIVEKPTSYTVPSGSLSTKLSYLRKVFPNGWYWNHWSASDLGSTYTQKSFTINGHSTSITNKPCVKGSSLHANVSNSTCNHYWGSWKGVQCLGFARMMFELVWDMDTETESYGMYYHPDTDNADLLDYVKPGDMIWTGGHAFLVTSVNGDTFTVVHCNRNSNCNIEWDYTYTKDWVHARMKGNKTGYVASPTPVVYGSDITNWVKYKVVGSELKVLKWASTSSAIQASCTMEEGDIFYVDMNHTITKNGKLFGYCKTASGKYGWVQYSNTSYAVPVEDECEHPDAEWVVIKMNSCTEDGLEHLICPDCNELLDTYTVPAIEHLASQWEITCDATCTGYGERIQTCVWCGELLNAEAISPTGHDEGEWVITQEPTCTEYGFKTRNCTRCGEVLETLTLGTTDHNWSEWVTLTEPTCIDQGEEARYCGNCGVIDTMPLWPLDHTAGDWVTIPPTCTEYGYDVQCCTVCGESIDSKNQTDFLGHIYGTLDTTKEATCTEEGAFDLYCTRCGDYLESGTLPPLGHTEGDWVVITEATATADGLKRQSCTVCGETLAEEVIPATGPESPLSSITMSAGSNLTALPGGTVTVPVSLNNPNADLDIGAILLRYTLPTGVTISNVEVCGIAAGADKQHSGSTLLSSLAGIKGSGKFLNIAFQVAESAAFPLTVKVSPEVTMLSTEAEITLPAFSILIEEGSARVPGDVNDDGKVSTADFLRLSKYLAEWPGIVINESNSDVNGDGKVSTADFLRLAKYLAEWPDIELK